LNKAFPDKVRGTVRSFDQLMFLNRRIYAAYHAKMKRDEKSQILADWKAGKVSIIVATVRSVDLG